MNRHEVSAKTLETGAVLTAVAVAFLGKVGLKPAMATPEALTPKTPTFPNKDRVPQHGLPPNIHFINNPTDINVEAQVAVSKLHKRENKAVVIHAPTKIKDAIINFAKSPSTTEDVRPGVGFMGQDLKGTYVITQYGVEKFKGVNYIVFLDEETSRFTFINYDWAKKTGAINPGDEYDLVGERHDTVAYNPYEDAPPTVLFKGEAVPKK